MSREVSDGSLRDHCCTVTSFNTRDEVSRGVFASFTKRASFLEKCVCLSCEMYCSTHLSCDSASSFFSKNSLQVSRVGLLPSIELLLALWTHYVSC